MTQILRFVIIILVLIIESQVFAQQKITNLIMPVSYFVNREQQLKEMQDYLHQYRKVSIIGTSGIGKTQLARVYAHNNRNNYDITWFFDGNVNLNEAFVKLAKRLNQTLNANITEDIACATREVMDYLSHKKKWLLIFDNLKIGNNNKVKEIVDWQHKGHIIFCSQDSENLPNILKIFLLDRVNTVNLAKNLLVSANDKDIEFLIEAFNGYPILIVHGSQLLNKIKGLNKEEYKNKIYQSEDKIELNINIAIKELDPNAVKLLNKIALINNQSVSKQLLSFITDNQATLNEDLNQLSKFLLIHNRNPSEENPIFEMHDIIADKLQKVNGSRKNRIYLEDIIFKLVNNIPENVVEEYLFRNSKTIHDNLKIIGKNAQKYNINIYKAMELNLQLRSQYVNSFHSYNCTKLVDWFTKNEQQGKFKLWLMSDYEKTLYASYLALIGWHYRNICKWTRALEYYTRAQEVLNNIKGYELIKYDLFYCLADINIVLGDARAAVENIQLMEKIFSSSTLKSKAEIVTLSTVKANLFYLQGKYEEALDELNKSIATLIANRTESNDVLLSVRYLLKSKILNSLRRYKEAYEQVKKSYKAHKTIEKENPAIYARIYTQFARSELGQGKLAKALEDINKAIEILLADERRNPKNADYSEDPELAASCVVQGEIFFAKNNLRKSIESYKKAYMIYSYLYRKNLQNVAQISDLYLQGAKVACKLKNIYDYSTFRHQQVREFGQHHPNTIAMLKYCKQYQGIIEYKN